MPVKVNIRSGESLQETSDGWQSTRIVDVSSLAGNGPAQLYLAALRGGVPQMGDAHPSIPGIVVIRKATAPQGADAARVTVLYGQPSADTPGAPAEVSFSADTIQEETVFDSDGNTIKTEYASIGSGGITLTTRVHRVAVERPTFTVSLTRVLGGVPKNDARDFVGRINSIEWSEFAARTWLCRSISSSQESPTRHRVTYTFTYKSDGWQAEVVTDVDGVIPNDATSDNGIRRVDVYDAVDFNRLGVSF